MLHLSQAHKRIISYRVLGISTGLVAGCILGLRPFDNFVINFMIEGMHTFLHWCVEKRCPDGVKEGAHFAQWVSGDDDILEISETDEATINTFGVCFKCQCCGEIFICLNKDCYGMVSPLWLFTHEMGHAVLFKLMGFWSEKTPFHDWWDILWGCLPST